MTETSIYL